MAARRRSRRRERPGPPGFLVIDKPSGVTSHDVVDEVRRRFGTRRVGHLGTLDPQATGVLPLALLWHVPQAIVLWDEFRAVAERMAGEAAGSREAAYLPHMGPACRMPIGDTLAT